MGFGARRTGAFIATVLVPMFAVLFCLGFVYPCMSLRLDMDLFYKQQPNLLPFKPFIDSVHLDKLVYAEISVWRSIVNLTMWLAEGDGNSGIALVMYGVFVSLFTVVDMFALFIMALKLRGDSGISSAKKSKCV